MPAVATGAMSTDKVYASGHMSVIFANGVLIFAMEVNSELLINEICKYPELWDPSNISYKDRNKKNDGWNKICISLLDGFEQRSDEDKKLIEKGLMAKWKTLRDSYMKYKKKLKCGTGSARKPLHKYIFADHLGFLDKCSTPRATESSLRENFEKEHGETDDTDEAEEPSVSDQNLNSEPNPCENTPNSEPNPCENTPLLRKKPRRKATLEEELSSYIKLASKNLSTPSTNAENTEQKEDDDMSFFKSLLPSVKKLNEVKKLEFRMNVMENLKALLSPPVQQAYHVPPYSNFFHPSYSQIPPTPSEFGTIVTQNNPRPMSSNTSNSISPHSVTSPWNNNQSTAEFSAQNSPSFD